MTASPLDPPLSLFLMAGSKAQCPGKRFAQRPRGWGWAGPGAPWRGLGRELQPFYALCVPGSHFHFYRKGFLLPLTKLVFSCLISERVRHTMSSKTRMWGQVQRRDSAHASAYLAGCFPELSPSRGFAWSPRPCSSDLSRVWPERPFWLVPQDSGLCFIPATGLSPKESHL